MLVGGGSCGTYSRKTNESAEATICILAMVYELVVRTKVRIPREEGWTL
ncbi:hypothetical protein [Rubritalea tangerina]